MLTAFYDELLHRKRQRLHILLIKGGGVII
jgi:hypothetical protein